MRKAIIFLLFWLVIVLPTQAPGQTLTFATVNWEPYAGETLPDKGITSVIIAKACKLAGLEAEFRFMPWPRAMDETRSGKYDAVYNAYFSKYRDSHFGISEPYFTTHLTLCTKADTTIRYDGSVESLLPYRLGVVRGFVNTEAIDQEKSIMKDEAINDVMNLNKLLHNRVDLIVIDKYQALHLVKNNPTIEADVNDIRFISPKLDTKKLHVLFSKETRGWQSIMRRFNNALRKMKSDGTIDELMLRFGFVLPEKQ